MADISGPVASAVVLPEADAPNHPPKRRQSSVSDSASKRARVFLDADSNSSATRRVSPHPVESAKQGPEVRREEDGLQVRRKSSVQEEKKRGQRLFGGILSALSQSTPNGQQKRRLEIEKRQHERVKQQKDADEQQRREKLADLNKVRKTEQIKYDEAEYYNPWKLLPGDEERIKTQIEEAEMTIEREVSQFELRYTNQTSRTDSRIKRAGSISKETPGEPLTEPPSVSVSKIDVTTNHTPQQSLQSEPIVEEKRVQDEHNGEVVVENDEDTVIY